MSNIQTITLTNKVFVVYVQICSLAYGLHYMSDGGQQKYCAMFHTCINLFPSRPKKTIWQKAKCKKGYLTED